MILISNSTCLYQIWSSNLGIFILRSIYRHCFELIGIPYKYTIWFIKICPPFGHISQIVVFIINGFIIFEQIWIRAWPSSHLVKFDQLVRILMSIFGGLRDRRAQSNFIAVSIYFRGVELKN